MADLSSIIAEAAARYKLSPEMMLRIAKIESNMNPNSANPRSSARGVYQFLTKPGGSWSKYGNGGDPLDPVANVDAGARYILDNQKALRNKLGRDPADWETYFAHQQGAGGAPALLMNPNRPAAEVLQAFYKNPQTARDAIALNGGNPDAPASEFANMWKAKYEGTPVPAAGAGGTAATNTNIGGGEASGVTNPAALAMNGMGPAGMGPGLGLGSLFTDALKPLAKPGAIDPNAMVRRPTHKISDLIGDLGKPVQLSSIG